MVVQRAGVDPAAHPYPSPPSFLCPSHPPCLQSCLSLPYFAHPSPKQPPRTPPRQTNSLAPEAWWQWRLQWWHKGWGWTQQHNTAQPLFLLHPFPLDHHDSPPLPLTLPPPALPPECLTPPTPRIKDWKLLTDRNKSLLSHSLPPEVWWQRCLQRRYRGREWTQQHSTADLLLLLPPFRSGPPFSLPSQFLILKTKSTPPPPGLQVHPLFPTHLRLKRGGSGVSKGGTGGSGGGPNNAALPSCCFTLPLFPALPCLPPSLTPLCSQLLRARTMEAWTPPPRVHESNPLVPHLLPPEAWWQWRLQWWHRGWGWAQQRSTAQLLLQSSHQGVQQRLAVL
jgi:hypothetical protein